MNRPAYETPADLIRETKVAKVLALTWDVEVAKLKPFYSFDWAFIWQGNITGLCEIKCRTTASDAYPTYMISATKIRDGILLRDQFDLEMFLVVAWTDRVGWIKIKKPWDYELKLGGREDRNDEQDIEPCFFIPVSDFNFIANI